jgi:hypothetical protein
MGGLADNMPIRKHKMLTTMAGDHETRAHTIARFDSHNTLIGICRNAFHPVFA